MCQLSTLFHDLSVIPRGRRQSAISNNVCYQKIFLLVKSPSGTPQW